MSGEAKHTPGPWRWFGRTNGYLCLATVHGGRRFVMDFARHGMEGGQPRFQSEGLMHKAVDLATFEVDPTGQVRGYAAAKTDPSIYRYDISGIDHPDARLIAAAPDLLEALENLVVWHAVRNEKDEVLPAEQQPAEMRLAMTAIAKAYGETP